MKNIALVLCAASIAALAAATVYHADTGRYQIAQVGAMATVYRVDTRTGDIWVCSAAYEKSCMTLEEASNRIAQQRETVMNTARQAGESLNDFTREKAEDLRNMLDNLTSDPEAPTQP